jgi:hypothetical protein
MRGRPDVEVLGRASKEQIANAAADEICGVVVLMQPVQYLQSIGVDLSA